MKQRLCCCSKQILWELNFFLPINLHDAGHVSENALYVAIDEKEEVGGGGGGGAVYFLLHDIKSTIMWFIDKANFRISYHMTKSNIIISGEFLHK